MRYARPIPFDLKVQARRERAANAARWSQAAAERPNDLLWQATVLASGAFVLILLVLL